MASPKRTTWSSLRKNPLAFTGLIVIVLSTLLAIFGYFLVPDPTPFADNQTVEIQAKSPGYTQQFLAVLRRNVAKTSFFTRLLTGEPSQFTYVPISGYHV